VEFHVDDGQVNFLTQARQMVHRLHLHHSNNFGNFRHRKICSN
jgi:hypothetical protein